MKIHLSGNKTVELRDEPRDFAGGVKGKAVMIEIGDNDVILGYYGDHDRARAVLDELHDVYFSGAAEYTMPKE